jgi:hypothetical protein
MLAECVNPVCHRELHYLRDGRVIRMGASDGRSHVEHFWLCGECCTEYNFKFFPDGSFSLVRRSVPEPEKPALDIASMVA